MSATSRGAFDPPVILLLGPTNAGKSTVVRVLRERFDIAHFAVRAHFSKETLKGTEVGRRALELSRRQPWLPDDFVGEAFGSWLDTSLRQAPAAVVLEGFPRNSNQALVADDLLSSRGLAVTHLVHLDAPDEVLTERARHRLVCTRCDTVVVDGVPVQGTNCTRCRGEVVRRREDSPGRVEARIAAHRTAIGDLLAHYTRATLHMIDAASPRHEVRSAVLKAARAAGLTRRPDSVRRAANSHPCGPQHHLDSPTRHQHD